MEVKDCCNMFGNEIFKCPVCSNALTLCGNSFICSNRHSFDIASKGYVNLLLSHQKGSKEPGDNKQMVAARNAFLNTGSYKKLSETINTVVVEHIKKNEQTKPVNILDAGCGEGYYIDSLEKDLKDSGIEANLFGIDISKDAIRLASSRNSNICLAVASSFNIPIISNSINCLLQLFTPFCNDEFSRVMDKGAIIISVMPGKRHLFGLKELLYDIPYINDEDEYMLESFMPINNIHLQYDIVLEKPDDIKNLFMMTPYYWRTNAQKISNLYEINRLETPVEFVITTYLKK